ncbi:hypothetical protein CHL78_016220 [Romboutsia weinsteinii]|uniref:Uncharacterized protein n=1 Tax=Romboutsia weinsteinii TaxID=2020949 RepID=A0A371IZC7_9FIRM|nr:hypothetical protein [Romboutsia weinsteinii]RDY25841.1 hypothetical protein CHL78_016220 [Romboutsia weinsteinii]
MRRKTREEYRREVREKTNGEYKLIGDYINNTTKTFFKHNTESCKHEFHETPKRFNKYKYPCPECRKELKRKNNIKKHKVFVKEVEDLYGNEYSVKSQYNGSKENIIIQHNSEICDYNNFKITPNNFLRGHGCSECNLRNTSKVELSIFFAINTIIPETCKKKIKGRECDIVIPFDKLIGIQYDGHYFHQNPEKDNSFNKIFLKEKKTDILIRVREVGCPDIDEIENLFIINTEPKYNKEIIQSIVDNILSIINERYDTEYKSIVTDEIIDRAIKASTRVYHYKKLYDEYKEFIKNNKRPPIKDEQNSLRSRINEALRNNKLDKKNSKEIYNIRTYYCDIKEFRTEDEIFEDLKEFFKKNTFLPRQASIDEEKKLYNELKRCTENKLFSPKQNEELSIMKKQSINYIKSEEEIRIELEKFIKNNNRMPQRSDSNKEENLLISSISHRISRNSLSDDLLNYIIRVREYYSIEQSRKREYLEYIKKYNKLPKGDSTLNKSVLRFMSNGKYSKENIIEIINYRYNFQSLKKTIIECEKYLGLKKGDILYKIFLEFIKTVEDRELKLKDNDLDIVNDLVKEVIKEDWFDEEQKKYIKLYHEIQQINSNCVNKTIEKFIEFINTNNRMPSRGKNNVEAQFRRKIDSIIKKYRSNPYIDISVAVEIYDSHIKQNTAENTFNEAMNFYEKYSRLPKHRKGKTTELEYERKLAYRITSILDNNGFTNDQKEILNSLLFKNKERPKVVLNTLIDFYNKYSRAPKCTNGKEEKRIISNIRYHIKSNHYSDKEIDSIKKILPYAMKDDN